LNKRKAHRGVFERPPASGVWWISYCDGLGKRHREKIGRRNDAIEAYLQRKQEIRGGSFVPPRSRDQILFRQLVEECLAWTKPRRAAGSYRKDVERSRKLLATLGHLPAARIAPIHIERALGALRVSGSTSNRYRALLSSVYSYGMMAGKVQSNPVAKVSNSKEPPHRVRFLSADEEAAIRVAILKLDKDLEPVLDLALSTGIRRGEQYALRWEHVDLGNSVLTVTGKTGRRFVPINETARTALLRLHRTSNGSEYVCQGRYSRWFERAIKATSVPNFKWHDLRHTFASRLVMQGASVYEVQVLLGHKTAAMTERYAHLSPEHLRSTVNLLDRFGTKVAPRTMAKSASME
jgi:integrase